MTLSVRAVSKSYGRVQALDGVDLSVARGEICGLLGPNGAGKTTLVSIVAGLLQPDAGTVCVDGVDVLREPAEARRRLGLAPQDLGIYPRVSVRENLDLFGRLAGLRGTRLRQRSDEVAEALAITHLLDRPAGLLSGGEQRRTHTAMALLHRPALVMLDEPTVGADVQSRMALLDVVRELAASGSAVCYSTHYLQEIEALDASVALIHQGRIIARGSVDELVSSRSDSVVELRFDGDAPDIDVHPQQHRDGPLLRVPSREPATDAARITAALGPDAGRLVSIEFVRASLESVFVQLTGQRLNEEVDGVVRV